MANFQPVDPVALGLCKQVELDAIVAKATRKSIQVEPQQNTENIETLVSTDNSLTDHDNKVPSNIAGLEDFSLNSVKIEEEEPIDPESLFSLPNKDKE